MCREKEAFPLTSPRDVRLRLFPDSCRERGQLWDRSEGGLRIGRVVLGALLSFCSFDLLACSPLRTHPLNPSSRPLPPCPLPPMMAYTCMSTYTHTLSLLQAFSPRRISSCSGRWLVSFRPMCTRLAPASSPGSRGESQEEGGQRAGNGGGPPAPVPGPVCVPSFRSCTARRLLPRTPSLCLRRCRARSPSARATRAS